jgi:hypothetical protein
VRGSVTTESAMVFGLTPASIQSFLSGLSRSFVYEYFIQPRADFAGPAVPLASAITTYGMFDAGYTAARVMRLHRQCSKRRVLVLLNQHPLLRSNVASECAREASIPA